MNLRHCFLDGVGHPPELDVRVGEDDVTTVRVAIPRLSDAPHVAHQFLVLQRKLHLAIVGPEKTSIFGENTWNVRVPLKAVALDEGKDALEFSRVVDILGEDVLVERVANTAVHEREWSLAMRAGEFAQKIPALLRLVGLAAIHFELLPGPENSPFRAAAEAFRIVERSLVVISQDGELEFHHLIDAFARIGTIAHDIAEAVDAVALLTLDVGQDGLQRVDVAVDIANYRSFHA